MSKRKQLGILFSKVLYYKMKILAAVQEQTVTQLMENAITEYLKRNENESKKNKKEIEKN